MQNNEARGGNWMGDIRSTATRTTRSTPTSLLQRAARRLLAVHRDRQVPRDAATAQWLSEWYAQDTWRADPRLTVDYGARFLWYTPYVKVDDQVANFDPAKYDPAKAPRLYLPALVNGTRVAFDPVTGSATNAIFVGAYVPGTGNETNGMVHAAEAGVPRGFRKTLAPQIEPRLGFA